MRWLWIGLVLGVFSMAQSQPQKKDEDQAKKQDGSKQTIMETMTITAERAPVKVKETPARVTVIDAEQIAREMAQDVSDLVRYEPGVYVSRDGSRLNLNGFNIRGIGGNRVRTQIDGVRTAEQYDFTPFTVHQYFVDVETLKSVEILRGAASSLYGSDALGGQVSFQTKDPVDYFGPTGDSYYQVKAGYAGQNNANHFGATAAVRAGRFDLLGHVVLRQQEAWENQGRNESRNSSRTVPNDQDGDLGQYMLKAIRPIGDHSRLRMTAEFYDSEVETQVYTQHGTTDIFGVLTEVDDVVGLDRQNRFRFSVDQTWDPQNLGFADFLQWQVHAQTSDTIQETSEFRSATVGPVTQNIHRTGSIDFDQQTLGANVILRKIWATSHTTSQLSYGASYEQTHFEVLRDRRDADLDTGNPDAYDGSLIFPTRYFPKSTVRQTGVYAEFENQLFDGRLKVVPGVRYDRYELDPDENDTVFLESTQATELPEALDDDALTGKLGVQLELNEHLAISGQFAMGYRTPPYNSVNSGFTNLAGGYQTLANPDLDPETSENLEFSVKTYNSRGSALFTYFDNHYDDFIQDTVFVGVSNTGIALFQPQNIDQVDIHGFEFQGDWRLTDALWVQGAYADITGENADTGAPLDTIEPQKGVLGLQYRWKSEFGATLNGTFVSSKNREDATAVNDVDPFLPDSYQLLDLTMFWQPTDHIVVHLGGFNLTDETYWQWSQVRGRAADDPVIDRYTSPGRTLRFDIQYRW